MGGHGNIVKCLHHAGADINIRSHDGSTAVMMAAIGGLGGIVQMSSISLQKVQREFPIITPYLLFYFD